MNLPLGMPGMWTVFSSAGLGWGQKPGWPAPFAASSWPFSTQEHVSLEAEGDAVSLSAPRKSRLSRIADNLYHRETLAILPQPRSGAANTSEGKDLE